jgi:hypothetical protein
MIKATCHDKNGRTIALLGITDMNIVKLREGKPIQIHGEEMGLGPIDIWIITGKDESEIQQMLAPLIGPQTNVRDHRLTPKH